MRRNPLRSEPGKRPATARMRLAACLAIAGVVWLGVLPWIGQRPTVRTAIQRNETLGIDPSAKFYSEMPAMPGIIRRVEDLRGPENGPKW